MPQAKANPVLEEFKNALAESKHLYACGGRIPVVMPTVESGGDAASSLSRAEQPRRSGPVTIRWDVGGLSPTEESRCRKVTLPATRPADRDALKDLLQDCQPATFGQDGKDVYDETYRKALKMNTDTFCSTFDPYSVGIVDSVAQMLLPSFLDSATHRAVEARLYKLNIYSGPSGMFKAHVDTPRSPMQFGSLVVCLPVEHQGGQLKVRHKGEEMTFDWGIPADERQTPHIEWAAFYSDCEHEVMEVSSGTRLTLTYNLYAVQGAGRLTGTHLTLDPTRLPLYRAIEKVISNDPFYGKGGTLGFWCSHAYAYNNQQENPLPETLKGVDAAVWESLKALGISVETAPIVEMDGEARESYCDYYEESDQDEGSDYHEVSTQSKGRMPPHMPSKWIIGKKFGVAIDRGYQVEDAQDYHRIFTRWGGTYANGPIHWLTKPTQTELQIVYTTAIW
ncbi:2OG-Fe(II) oxygenase family [Cordyceps militaris]|uniref:2OG-Fe(II) oxygenase family n=1 Tax=Cordyceps militaris TaxID=73501 RepID=A0A2H4S8F5_CORMI|nr:2OG-Fe(II) oxygenase family [Cordyceps militaris]